jgi:predicted ArsR family transcriptional regulator
MRYRDLSQLFLFFVCYFLFLIYNEDVNGYERKIVINNILKSEGRIQINELAERLEVTKVTVRSDLDDLEKRGLLLSVAAHCERSRWP